MDDSAAAIMMLAEKLGADPSLIGHPFNFSNELQINVLQLVEMIAKIMGFDIQPDIRNEASHEIRHQYLSAAKARKILN